MLPTLDADTDRYAVRRERVFLVLAGIFLCAMTLLNVLGITRFVHLVSIGNWPMVVAIGVLPYPITFLCTDLVCELYGRRRANYLVTVGLGLNIFIVGVLMLANALPSAPAGMQPPWQTLSLAADVGLPNGSSLSGEVETFSIIYATTVGAVFASMMAYLAAQYCDVQLFHFWKRLTRGKHLWLRNNFSTLVSQLVDATVVISVTFGAAFLAGDIAFATLLGLVGSNYVFKMLVALADTLPFYVCVHYLTRYLGLPNPLRRDTSTIEITEAKP
ncbi:MAG: queuosine precursor transporter [Pseudomonadota bacterium]